MDQRQGLGYRHIALGTSLALAVAVALFTTALFGGFTIVPSFVDDAASGTRRGSPLSETQRAAVCAAIDRVAAMGYSGHADDLRCLKARGNICQSPNNERTVAEAFSYPPGLSPKDPANNKLTRRPLWAKASSSTRAGCRASAG